MEDNLKVGDIVKVIDINANGVIISINERGLYKVKFDKLYIPAFYKASELKFIVRPEVEDN